MLCFNENSFISNENILLLRHCLAISILQVSACLIKMVLSISYREFDQAQIKYI